MTLMGQSLTPTDLETLSSWSPSGTVSPKIVEGRFCRVCLLCHAEAGPWDLQAFVRLIHYSGHFLHRTRPDPKYDVQL